MFLEKKWQKDYEYGEYAEYAKLAKYTEYAEDAEMQNMQNMQIIQNVQNVERRGVDMPWILNFLYPGKKERRFVCVRKCVCVCVCLCVCPGQIDDC